MPGPLLPEVDVDVPAEGLTIGQVAKATGVSIEALRYYEREGLMLNATPRDAAGRRRYGKRDLAWISGLVMLRETGMPIADIRVIADLSRQPRTEQLRLDFFEKHRARVVEQLEQTRRHLAAIDRKIDSYRTMLPDGSKTIPRSIRMTDQFTPTTELHEVLSAWWDVVGALRVDSTSQDWNKMTAYLAEDCVVYFGGMGAPASVGVDAVVMDLKQLLSYWRIVERRVLAHGMDTQGSTVFASMKNRLEILGEPVDLPETEVVTFNDEQKITRYELYCDPSPIKAVFAEKRPTS